MHTSKNKATRSETKKERKKKIIPVASCKKNNRQGKKLIRHAQTVEIVFENIPETYTELAREAGQYTKSQNALVTWMRHNKCNYEAIITGYHNRFSTSYDDRLKAVDILRQRASDLCCRLIKELKEKHEDS